MLLDLHACSCDAEACLHCVAAHSSFQYRLLRGLSVAGFPFTCMQTCACDAVTGQDSDLPRLRKGLDRWSAQVCAGKWCCRVGATCYACPVTYRLSINEPNSCMLRSYIFWQVTIKLHACKGWSSIICNCFACFMSTAVTQVPDCALLGVT